jgi:ribonuclease PH
MNVVMLGRGDFVEVQGTAERAPFSKAQTDQMLTLAKQGIQGLIKIQKGQLGMRLS